MKKGMSTTLRIIMIVVILIIVTFVLLTMFTHQTGSFLNFARTTTNPETGSSGLCRACLVSYCAVHSPDTDLTSVPESCEKVCSEGVPAGISKCSDLINK